MRRPFNGTYPVTNDFGTPNPAYAAIYGRRHPGTDYGMPIGTPLCSPVNGVVTAARLDRSGFGRGYFVEILSDGKYYGLCHMNSVAVSEGQQVTEGTPIGPSGNTGLSTGPHLHMYVCLSPSPNVPLDQFLDPEELLNSAEAQGDTVSTEEILQSALNREREVNEILQSALNDARAKAEVFESALNAEREKTKKLEQQLSNTDATVLAPGLYQVTKI